MRDFSLSIYKLLLETLLKSGYHFLSFEEFILNNEERKIVVLRHDVDRSPANALEMAKIEFSLGIKATYYWRVVDNVWDENLMREVALLGNEVAYHYEDLTIKRGNYEKAINHFDYQLKRIRKIYPAKTICMHGSPLTKWDNRSLWNKYSYKDYGIIAEPYFDVDYNDVLYLTDTGRLWNNAEISVRDKVNTNYNFKFNSTMNIIHYIKAGKMPDRIMINTHPQRWFDWGIGWYRELLGQNVKNVIKYFMIKFKKD